MSDPRSDLHTLVDELPETAVDAATRRLQQLRADFASAAAVPDDDEPTTAEDLAAIEEGRAARERGETIPLEEWLGASVG